MHPNTLPSSERSQLLRRGRNLELFSVGWNILEGGVSVVAALLAGSVALLGFGIDSFIESLSALVLLWRLRPGDNDEQREQTALRLVGVAFLALAAYVAYDAVHALWQKEVPEVAPAGIAITLLSIIVMPILSRAKRRVAAELDSRALVADSRQTDICVYLSYITLGGLLLNALVGWWWADPLAGLLLVPIIVREGWAGLRGEECGCAGEGACHDS